MWKRPQLNEGASHPHRTGSRRSCSPQPRSRTAAPAARSPACRRAGSRPKAVSGSSGQQASFRAWLQNAESCGCSYLVGKGWTLPIAQAHLADQELVRPDDQSPRQGAWGADGEGQLLSRGDGGLPGHVAPNVGGICAKASMSQQGKHCQRSEAGEMSHRSGAVGTPRRRSCGGRPCAGPQDPPRLCWRNNGRLRTDLCT